MTNRLLFNTLGAFLLQANGSNKLNDKKRVVGQYEELCKLFNYVYDPFKMYHITLERLDDNEDMLTDEFIDANASIYDLLDMLTNRVVTGHDAIGTINYFISANKEFEKEIRLIISKDLRCRIGASVINKIFPGTVPEFKVALADKYKPEMAPKMVWELWLHMRKLDGARCSARVDGNGNTVFRSRKGHEFTTLGEIASEIKQESNIENFVLDGEICIVDENGKEDFQAIMRLIKKKDFTIPKPKFIVYDILTHQEFDSGYSDIGFIDRLARWNSDNGFRWDFNLLELLDFTKLESEEQFHSLMEYAVESGWEGGMLRKKNSPYQAKRTKDLLKVKKFHDAEYVVERIETGPFQIIDPDTGLGNEIETMTNVIISHKGYAVSVGSGFKLKERINYYEHPEEIIGAEITVQYFEETRNKNGGASLRFPTVKKVWSKETGRDI